MDTPISTRESQNRNGHNRSSDRRGTLGSDELRRMDAYWRAANYLSVGQIYLYDNPLLKRPLTLADVKRMLLGHWGTTPGQNFIYVHLNRVIKKYELDMVYVSGPGHGGPAVVGNTYLEGTYSEVYPDISQDEAGLRKLFIQFSFPGRIPSHASPECPGSIHEGGELGYSLSHSFGAVFDNPDLVVACVVGDGEAETRHRRTKRDVQCELGSGAKASSINAVAAGDRGIQSTVPRSRSRGSSLARRARCSRAFKKPYNRPRQQHHR
jgi:phosphoketolase